jgi:hypothetical protein
MSEENKDPKFVLDEVCDARMKSLETKLKYLFGSSLLTIILIVVQLLRGH